MFITVAATSTMMGRYVLAIANYERALSINQSDIGLLFDRGKLFRQPDQHSWVSLKFGKAPLG